MLMTLLAESAQTCPQIDIPVRTDQSEKQCRKSHGCSQRTCPLSGSFLATEESFLKSAVTMLDH